MDSRNIPSSFSPWICWVAWVQPRDNGLTFLGPNPHEWQRRPRTTFVCGPPLPQAWRPRNLPIFKFRVLERHWIKDTTLPGYTQKCLHCKETGGLQGFLGIPPQHTKVAFSSSEGPSTKSESTDGLHRAFITIIVPSKHNIPPKSQAWKQSL
jgi:hypothetical protein